MKWERRQTKFGLLTVPVRNYGDLSKAMSSDIKRISTSLKGMLEAVKQEVTACEDEVRQAQTETIDAVGMTRDMIKGVRSDVAELRGLLGVNTNNPPQD